MKLYRYYAKKGIRKKFLKYYCTKNIPEILQVYRKTFLKSYRYMEKYSTKYMETFLKSYGYTENIADEKIIKR